MCVATHVGGWTPKLTPMVQSEVVVEIVIDKSYLQGAPSETIRKLCEEHTVVFTETLFYELLSTEEIIRDRCFAKLPASDNPVVLIPCLGPLIRCEIEKQKTASPILDHRLALSFRFNPRLSSRTFQHSAHEKATLEQWRRDVEGKVSRFHQVATGVSSWCPSLKAVSGEALRIACKDLKKQACADAEIVRMVYRDIRPEGFPPASFLDPSWALFRWVQVNLLFALDYLGRYGFAELESLPQRVEHDIHDIEYVIFGALCGALATRDDDITDNFLLSHSDGKLLN